MSDKYTIEKNIPYPTDTDYPFAEMKVGDSFFAHLGGRSIQEEERRIDDARERAAQFDVEWGSWAFEYLRTDGGLRVWRVH